MPLPPCLFYFRLSSIPFSLHLLLSCVVFCWKTVEAVQRTSCCGSGPRHFPVFSGRIVRPQGDVCSPPSHAPYPGNPYLLPPLLSFISFVISLVPLVFPPLPKFLITVRRWRDDGFRGHSEYPCESRPFRYSNSHLQSFQHCRSFDRQNDLIVLRVFASPSARADVRASASARVRSYHVFCWAGRGLDPLDLVVFSSILSAICNFVPAPQKDRRGAVVREVLFFFELLVLFLGVSSRV